MFVYLSSGITLNDRSIKTKIMIYDLTFRLLYEASYLRITNELNINCCHNDEFYFTITL